MWIPARNKQTELKGCETQKKMFFYLSGEGKEDDGGDE